MHSSVFIDQQRSIWLTVISNRFKDKKPKQTGPEALIHTKRPPLSRPTAAAAIFSGVRAYRRLNKIKVFS